MAELDKNKTVFLEELMVSTLARTRRIGKLLIEIRASAIHNVSSIAAIAQRQRAGKAGRGRAE